jgi:hypothetical protein
MNSRSSILHRIREIEGNHPPSIKPATHVICAFGNRRQMKSIDKYAGIGIYKPNGESGGTTRRLDGPDDPNSRGGTEKPFRKVAMCPVCVAIVGNSQELTTNHKNNEQGGAEWTRTIRPKRT